MDKSKRDLWIYLIFLGLGSLFFELCGELTYNYKIFSGLAAWIIFRFHLFGLFLATIGLTGLMVKIHKIKIPSLKCQVNLIFIDIRKIIVKALRGE